MAKILKPLIFLTLIFFVAVYSVNAQASSETGGMPMRGEGAAAISGYTISNLHFSLGSDPSAIDVVEFDLDSLANQVMVSFDAAPGRAFSCRNKAGNHWACELEGVYLADVEQIHISASG